MSIVREIPTLNPSLEHLLKSSHRKSYNAKKIIIHEGDVSSSLYYIIGGSAGLFDFDRGDEGKRTARVIARSDCIISEVSYAQFKQIVAEDPAVMFLLTGQIFKRRTKSFGKIRIINRLS